MIDGEEWLEAAISHLATSKDPLAHVRIGPTERLDPYEQSETLRKAITLLAAILARQGMIVVLFGADVHLGVIRAGIIDERWQVTLAQDSSSRSVKLRRSAGGATFDFEALLT